MIRKLLVFRIYFPILLVFFSVSGCQENPTQTVALQILHTGTPDIQETIILPDHPTQTISPQPAPENGIAYGLTYQKLDGNRVLPGKGRVIAQNLIDLPLPETPNWLVAVPGENGTTWFAALEDGSIYSIFITYNGFVQSPPSIAQFHPDMPPAAMSSSLRTLIFTVPDPEQSPLTHPMFLPSSNLRAYITNRGEVRFVDTSNQVISTLDVNALPDARLLVDDHDRLLILSDPTEKYPHDVLGDQLEAESITLIETTPEIRITSRITLAENEVIEGIAPIWVDLDADGTLEIIATVSDLAQGARIVVFDELGDRVAEGPQIGQPFRWRHQIAAAEFGPAGEIEIAVVRTPHLNGTVEFYRLEGDQLSIVAEFPGITSHTLGSRNLDFAVSGDLDGDGITELLVLSPDLKEFIAVRRTSEGVEQAWRLPLDGTISTNPVGVLRPDGETILGVGRADGVLRLWMP